MDFTEQNAFSASAFMIRKTIQKKNLRLGEKSLGVLQTAKRNLALFINKKFNNIMMRDGGGYVSEKDALMELMQGMDKQSKDPKIMEKIKDQLEEELEEIKQRAKKHHRHDTKKIVKKKKTYKDQNHVLKTFIHDQISNDKLTDLYKSYKMHQLKQVIHDNKSADNGNNHEALIQKISDVADKGDHIEKIDEFFVTQTLQDPKLNVQELLNVKGKCFYL